MFKPVDSVLAAEYLISRGKDTGINLNITQVQKLMYLAYGLYLANNGVAFIDEQPRAWPYGPVFPKTRNKADVTTRYNIENPRFAPLRTEPKVQGMLDQVLQQAGMISAASLTTWSHQDGSPWDITRKQPNFKWNDVIPDDLIKAYFQNVTL